MNERRQTKTDGTRTAQTTATRAARAAGRTMLAIGAASMALGKAAGAPPPGVEALSCRSFLDSLGANSAISRRGESLEKTIACTRYTGLRWFRSGYESNIPVADQLELHRQTGARFSYGLLSGGTNIARLVEGARTLAAADALVAVEGNNEPNNWGVTYQGAKGGRMESWLPVAKLQRDLYAAVKADPVLKTYPVWSLTENGAQIDNVGLQFLTIPAGTGALMPDGTRYADAANCHNYICHPGWPGVHDNQAWIAADPGPACRVDGLYGNYGRTWRKKFAGYAEADLAALPRVTTETGLTIEDGKVSEELHGLLLLTFYLDQFKRGWSHTAVYLLRDRVDEAGNQRFGFYRPDYSPRPAADYLHNLTTLLADTGAGPAKPARLAYTLAGATDTVHDLLLQKSDGSFVLILWNERFASGGSTDVTVTLPAARPGLAVYDPTVGTVPLEALRDARTVRVTLGTQPRILVL